MSYAIEVQNLSKSFGSLHAVRDISFNVARGDVLGFLGPNGAGKSTAMKMITGFLEPTAGRVRVCGHDLHEEPVQLKSRIGYLPEGAPAYGEMTPVSFLEFIGEIRGLRGRHLQDRIGEVVRSIHLEAVLEQRIETLSKGYKRRVGLAQAILHDPEVLIMDEPTDGLDPNQKHEVRTLIREMASTKAIVISTHILEEVDSVCTRAIIIAGGRLLFEGTPGELEARSRLHNAVTLSVNRDSFAAQRELSALGNVDSVDIRTDSSGNTRLTVVPAAGTNIINEVTDFVRTRGWTATEVRVESGRLDEVFRTITTQQASGGART
ncbi:MAG: ABC transporter ATP-binding protein [Gammaproteobacteria bacterium]|nr:ABC transporter ATP-binding protein [Gammaproteobacteria bacterium]MCG3143311.1 Vitamin B12 import ATP-binding protein BtuD [Gammaproteobacteria bacterium]